MLVASVRPDAAGQVDGAAQTGQSLPGAGVTGAAQPAPASPAPFAPANQFIASALSFLTSLQDPRSAAASAVKSTADTVIAQGSSDLSSVLDILSQALNGSSASASHAATGLSGLASTASAAAASLTLGTSSVLVQALDQLGAAIGIKPGRPVGAGTSITA